MYKAMHTGEEVDTLDFQIGNGSTENSVDRTIQWCEVWTECNECLILTSTIYKSSERKAETEEEIEKMEMKR